ncbi:MAG: hypothetical protein ACYTGB_10775 [Planctomycetota bacterium]
MGKIFIRDHTMIAHGDVGYEQAGDFATTCDRFLSKFKTDEAVMDLSGITELVSPCLASVYEDCRVHRPVRLKVIVPEHLAKLFEPGELEGLYNLETI